MDYFYGEIQRLDWGFENPNTTGALIAMLAVAACGAALTWKKAFWFALPAAAFLIGALIHTLSRGGMVAFLAGFAVFLFSVRPRLNRTRIVTLVALAVLLVGYAHCLGGASRYVQGINGNEDRSLANRWLIYRVVPRMLLDAPDGWGKGNAADAYHQWYQQEGRSETYLNLVNSHFTWLVECPTWARLLYCCGWAFILLLTWPSVRKRWCGIVLAVWATFFIASCFSSVAHRPWIWPFPVVLLLGHMLHRLMQRDIPRRKHLIITVVGAIGAYGALLLFALIPTGIPRVYHRSGTTVVGSAGASVRIALCGTDRAILGEKLGHRLRAYVKEHPERSITLHETPSAIDSNYHTTVLVGDALEKFDSTTHGDLVLLNPPIPKPAWTPRDARSVHVLWGDLNPSPAWYVWQQRAAGASCITLNRQFGEGLYLEAWLSELPL